MMGRSNKQQREGITLPSHCGQVAARIENFNELDADCAADLHEDAYCILGEMENEFVCGMCRLSTDENNIIPTHLDVPAVVTDETIRAHFEFSNLCRYNNNRTIAYYHYQYIK